MPTILIAEAEEPLRDLLTSWLTRRGHTVIAASTGDEAIQLAITAQPALILMDLPLPAAQARPVAHLLQIHPATQQIPIIMLAAPEFKAGQLAAHAAAGQAQAPRGMSLREKIEAFIAQNSDVDRD